MGVADDRRFEVLRAIVADFVATKEPIGSKALVERHNLGVSPATVRNDMAVLEAEGYIAQPHTSVEPLFDDVQKCVVHADLDMNVGILGQESL